MHSVTYNYRTRIYMTKKLTKQGDNLTLVIDKPILENLGITEKTLLDVIVMGDVILIKPRQSSNNKNLLLEKTATSIMDKYESVFKKLAKT